MTQQVLLVGLGTIAQVHLEALALREDVEVVGAVDPRVPTAEIPVHPSLDAALAAGTAPDLVVVATPTPTHVALVREVLEKTGATVLSEKPLAATLSEIDSLADGADRIRVSHHFAFSPEVEWAVQRTAGWGRPVRIRSTFHDAYAGFEPERLASYTSSWVDSGPNQLSLLAPFTGSVQVRTHDDATQRAVTVLDFDGGSATLSSNWLAADSSKQTVLEYADRSLRLDHTSMTASVVEHGAVTEHVGYAGTLGRKLAHYAGVYDAVLRDDTDVRLSLGLAADIARVLEQAAQAPSAGTTFTTL